MKKTIWRPALLGVGLGLLASIISVTGLSFLTPGITENAIGFYATLFLLAAALGGPLAGIIAPTLFVASVAWIGPPDMKAALSDPIVFWSNVLAQGTTVALVGVAYRLIFERVKMPLRLLAWSAIVIAYYVIGIPSSVAPQHWLSGDPASEILPAVRYGYETYLPQAIFDIVFTSLVFIALPARYRWPLWVEPQPMEQLLNDGS